MSRIKVATIVGTRPELIKLSRVIAELDRHVDHTLIHTGQNFDYELNQVFFEQLDLPQPQHYLEAAGETPAETVANVIAKTDRVLARLNPDAVLLLGDTNSCLAVIAAKKRQIPVFHMEAGNRSFDQRIPEETNRKVVDHLSDINLPYTEHARRYLVAEGLDPARVIKTGSPMREVLEYYMPNIEASTILEDLNLEAGGYFVASAHREENIDDPERLSRLMEAFRQVHQEHRKPIIFSTHPRTRAQLDKQTAAVEKEIRFLRPLGFLDYIWLQRNAACVISDSGSLTEEVSLLNLPAVTIREAHERPEGMDEATLVMSGLEPQRVLQAVELVMAQHRTDRAPFDVVNDYRCGNVSKKVVRIILSYIDYVNANVWRKQV